MISIAAWNVNSIRTRLPQCLAWLRRDRPDVVLLQETKVMDDGFPRLEFEDLGYNLALSGEKSYNGVAIFSKYPLEDVRRGLPGDDSDMQARYIEAVLSIPATKEQQARGGGVIRVASVYVPNGQTTDSDKYAYKLRFLTRLAAHARTLLAYDEPLVIGGDFNIAPADLDVHDPAAWEGSVLTHLEARAKLRTLLYSGLHDAYRILHPAGRQFSWWDYRGNGWARDDGLRIDHLLLSPQAADRLEACGMVRDMRGEEKASDHVPVLCQLAV